MMLTERREALLPHLSRILQGVKVIFWATSMVDTDSSNYETAVNNSFLIRNALDEFTTLKWWHGKGGLLDFTNPTAVSWWHQQLDLVLALGIDGWKVTDKFVCLCVC
jgi:alpha-glucosidase (family GH31 glycosyl hydrolase)